MSPSGLVRFGCGCVIGVMRCPEAQDLWETAHDGAPRFKGAALESYRKHMSDGWEAHLKRG